MRGLWAAMLLFGLAPASPAAAQITFGSPGEAPHVALEAGVYDVVASSKKDSAAAAELRGEFRFGDVFWIVSPFFGASGTSQGGSYTYVGFGFDTNFGPNWVLTPNVAVGYWSRGRGIYLGSEFEIRSGAELDFRLPDSTRVGVAFHHMSNAGITKQNPGEESVTLVYSVPLY